jgi:hypothetical protein
MDLYRAYRFTMTVALAQGSIEVSHELDGCRVVDFP